VSLPYEILAVVFGCFVAPTLGIHEILDAELWESDFKYGIDCPCSADHADLVAISQVCRPWRKIVLGIPSFWNPIWVTDHDYALGRAPEFFRRACHWQVPLEVAVVDDTRNPDSAERFHDREHTSSIGLTYHPMVSLLNLHHQIGSFMNVLRITSSIPLVAEGFFKMPMPILESLVLESLYDTAGSVYRLPDPLFGGDTPNLRKVSLKSVDFSWDDPLFKNLTLLRIWDDSDRRVGTIPNTPLVPTTLRMQRFFQIMTDCPELVTLDLAFVGPVIPANFMPNARVSLPHLRHLVLTGMENAASCHCVLSGLRVPCLQRLHLNHFGFPEPHIDMLLPADFSFNPIIARTQTIDISLDWGESMVEVNYLPSEDVGEPWEDLNEVFSTTAPRGGRMVVETDAICKFRYETFEYEDPEFTALYLSFIQRFCSPQTQELVLCDLGRFGSDLPFDSQALFAHFSSVQRLVVQNGTKATGASFRSVMALLKSFSKDAEMSGDKVVALPSLKIVSFVDVDISEGFCDFCVFLRHRKGRSEPLEEVEIIGAKNIRPNMLDDLRELSGTVTVYNDSDTSAVDDASSFLVGSPSEETEYYAQSQEN